MKVRHAVAIAATGAIAAGGTGIAAGDGTGGPPSGQLTFKVKEFGPRYKQRSGINPSVPRDKTRPKVADMLAGWGQIIIDGKVVGRDHHLEVTTFTPPGRKYRGKAVAHWFEMFDFGSGNQLYAECLAEDSPTDNQCAITGGTGRYAGARGTAVFQSRKGVENRKKQTFTEPVVVTFMT